MQKNLKGQLTVGNLFNILIIGIFLIVAVLPIVNEILAEYFILYPDTDTITTQLLNLIPVVLVIMYIIGSYYYAVPQKEAYTNV